MNLKRVRWATRLVLAAGVAASVGANILHAKDNPISQAIAGWPPVALLLTIELVSRVPATKRPLMLLRVLATAVISGIAGWVSYWHMAAVAGRYGETGSSPYLLPISVDGLIVVASISLVELSAKIRSQEPENRPKAADPSSYLAKTPGGLITGEEPLPNDSTGDPLAPVDVEPLPKASRGGDEIKARAIEFVRAYTGERTLTGKALGEEFGRSQTWGRAVLRESRNGHGTT